MKICIVGLGLMGASLARALKGFAEITGVDIDPDVCAKAAAVGAVSYARTDMSPAADADWVIFCVYAKHIAALLDDASLKKNAVISDICGVKIPLKIPENTRYVSLHPMAGKERDGIDNADPAIFKNTGFIIVRDGTTDADAIDLARRAAEYIGAGRVIVTDTDTHNRLIAYTSGLMHAAAAALCHEVPVGFDPAFCAGAFRDCTRIADINAAAWTELLSENSRHLIPALDGYIHTLTAIRDSLSLSDADSLQSILQKCGENKRAMNNANG